MAQTSELRFLSSLRRGAASQIAEPDSSEGDGIRASLDVSITFNVEERARTATVPLTLHGPADVVGFDARAVTRVWPPRETRDAEPNYFPLIEFDQVDLPWRYTPRAANSDGRLRPWFCLLALKETEFDYEPPRGDRRLGKVTIHAGTPMPRLDQSYAWAHVQVGGSDSEEQLAEVLANSPQRAVARMLCPRKLEERTTYWCMLVPVFGVGRLAGLREAVSTGASLDPAWTEEVLDDEAELELPVYFRWRFGTGDSGDFESLVRRVVPKPITEAVGTRPFDLASPGGGLPDAAVEPITIGGALQSPDADPWAWPEDEGQREDFVNELAELLNKADDAYTAGAEPIVGPPLYGKC